MYSLENTPKGVFYCCPVGAPKYECSAQFVMSSLLKDGGTKDDGSAGRGYHNVVDLGVSNMGRFGIGGKRTFLFVPAGRDLSKVRGF